MGDRVDAEDKANNEADEGGTTWGPKLFLGTAVAVLVFFWWLLIYSGGVTGHHG